MSTAFTPSLSADSRHRLVEKAGEVKQGIGEMASLAAQAAGEQAGAIRDASARTLTQTRQRLHSAITTHPFESVALGVGIGILACWMFGPRR